MVVRYFRNNLFWRLDRTAIERILAENPGQDAFAIWAQPMEGGGHVLNFRALDAEALEQEERDKVAVITIEGRPPVEITPAMLEAGARILDDYTPGGLPSDEARNRAREVFEAMVSAGPETADDYLRRVTVRHLAASAPRKDIKD